MPEGNERGVRPCPTLTEEDPRAPPRAAPPKDELDPGWLAHIHRGRQGLASSEHVEKRPVDAPTPAWICQKDQVRGLAARREFPEVDHPIEPGLPRAAVGELHHAISDSLDVTGGR